MNQSVVLRPHVKQGDTKANSYAFGLSDTSNKRIYLTREELEWLSENAVTIKQVLAKTHDQVRSASERQLEREVKQGIKTGNKKLQNTVDAANMGAMLQALMAQMQVNQGAQAKA